MKKHSVLLLLLLVTFLVASQVYAQQKKVHPKKPNIIMLISDDTGWGDLGVYGGGVGRGMPTPNLVSDEHTTMNSRQPLPGQPACVLIFNGEIHVR